MLKVTIYGSGEEEDVFDGVDYVSLVNEDTYGPPPLVAPTKQEPRPLAKVAERVLYINTRLVPLFEITRIADR